MPKYPKPIGPYSVYKFAGDFVYLAGQIGINPDTGELESDIESQTERVLTNIANILSEIGLTLDHVVKTTIFLKNMEDFPKVNEIYGKYFKENYPARSTVAVSELPKGALVEIEVVAYIPSIKEEIENGLESFLERSYFESHEWWEKAWRRLEEPLKSELRALIHIDAALIKLKEGNTKGARIHIERALNLSTDEDLKAKLHDVLNNINELSETDLYEGIKGHVQRIIKTLF